MAEIRVKTRSGELRGEVDGKVNRFLGVPFADTTAGRHRFAAPRAVPPWRGVRDATRFGPIAPQVDGSAQNLPKGTPQSEDCLSLNVWAPSTPAPPRAVMVWLHGGGYMNGASRIRMYDGRALAERGDVVVVSLNYRLGALGFLHHPELADPEADGGVGEVCGNWGLLDQIAGLEWVRDNIAEFGGDPDCVTLFGESAGGGSVACLLTAPRARGLFHRAVVQSGSPSALGAERASRRAEALADVAGVSGVAALRALPAAEVVRASAAVARGDSGGLALPFSPVIDGSLLPAPLTRAMREGRAAPVPVVIGSNVDEWKLFGARDRRARELDDAGLRERMRKRLPGTDLDAFLTRWRAAREARGESAAAPDLWFAIESERVFRVPALRIADALATRPEPVFVYLFDWESPAMRGWLGACHGLEIAFVFGTHALDAGMERFCGKGPEADRLSREMMAAWTSFAREGVPVLESEVEWASWESATRPTLRLGRQVAIDHDPRSAERELLYAELDRLASEPLATSTSDAAAR